MKKSALIFSSLMLISNLAVANEIDFCEPIRPDLRVWWKCDCQGNCNRVCVNGQAPCNPPEGADSSGAQMRCTGAQQFTVSPGSCVWITCDTNGAFCGDPADGCDDSRCRADDVPVLSVNESDPGLGKLQSMPTCPRELTCDDPGTPKTGEQVCRPIGFGRNGGPTKIGDPIDVSGRQSSHANVDLSIHSSLGEFQFVRFYTSASSFWKQGGGVGTLSSPFGRHVDDPNSMEWSHSLFSFVREDGGALCLVTVRRTDGALARFTGCGTGSRYLQPDGAARELGLRLLKDALGFVLVDGDRRYHYKHSTQSGAWLLSSITSLQTSPTRPSLVELGYQSLAACPVGPQLVSALIAGQRNLTLQYRALPPAPGSALANCALESIKLDGATTAAVTYEYTNRALTRAFGEGLDQRYTYPGQFSGLTPDGGIVPLVDRTETCAADTAEFRQLLAQADCSTDADCRVFRHELDIPELHPCYAVRTDVLASQRFRSLRRELERQCGHANLMTTMACEVAECVAGRCSLK